MFIDCELNRELATVLELNFSGELVIKPSPEDREKLLVKLSELEMDAFGGRSICEEELIVEEG